MSTGFVPKRIESKRFPPGWKPGDRIVFDLSGNPIQSGRKYHVETADRWFYVDVFYNEEGEFVAKEVGGTEQLVLSVGPANWEAV